MKDKGDAWGSHVPATCPTLPVTPAPPGQPLAPLVTPSLSCRLSLSPEAGAATAASKQWTQVNAQLALPRPFQGAPRPPGPEVPDCQMSPHPSPHLHARSLASRRAPRDPYPACSCPWNTHCSGLHTPVLVDYPTGPPQTLSTQDQAPGGGTGSPAPGPRLPPSWLPGAAPGRRGRGSSRSQTPWSPGQPENHPAGRQPSTLRSAGHPQRPQARLHTGSATAAALQPHGQRRARNTGHSVSAGSQTPTGSLQAPSGGKAAKSLTS